MISEFPLFVFTTLAGLSAGAYVVAAFLPMDSLRGGKRPWMLPLVAILLLGIGLLGVLGHLGRPLHFLNALANPTSMISEEAYWSISFGILLLIDLGCAWFKRPCPSIVCILAGVGAAGLIAVMSTAYFTSYGNPAWAAWPTIGLYIFGDLAMGAALCTLFANEERGHRLVLVASVLSALAAISFVAVGVHFNANGLGIAPFIVAAVLAIVAAILQLVVYMRKMPRKVGLGTAFVLIIVAVAVARYAFYAASIL